jgi:hypothetical protein
MRAQRRYLDLHPPDAIERALHALEWLLYERPARGVPIERPIFVIGCHRSGTTVLYEALARHPDVAYFTNASSLLPRIPMLINQGMDLIGEVKQPIERFARDGLTISHRTPSEGIRIWELHAPDSEDHYLDETHDDPVMEAYLRTTIRKHLHYRGASRFINKNPDNSARIRYLNKLFPDAYFIHIVRDGRAVCGSLLKFRQAATDFFGPEHRHARSGIKVQAWPEIRRLWDSDPVLSVGLLWREVMDTIDRDSGAIAPDRFVEIRYEDLVTRPLESLRLLCSRCALPWTARSAVALARAADALRLDGRNDVWRTQFDDGDLSRLMRVIGPTMRRHGYDAQFSSRGAYDGCHPTIA